MTYPTAPKTPDEAVRRRILEVAIAYRRYDEWDMADEAMRLYRNHGLSLDTLIIERERMERDVDFLRAVS